MTPRPERGRGGNSVVLQVRDLASGPPGVKEPTVRNVSLEIRSGEWLGITGPNGAGKTTLVLALAGLWPTHAGHRDSRSGGREPRIVTILQEPSTQITQRSVRDELAFTALNLGFGAEAAGRAAVAWATRFGLGPMLEGAPELLSAGQQQCVLLAAALAAKPEVLIADEAAAHLDPDARLMILEILRECVDAGLALVWVTQDPVESRRADRVIEVGVDGQCRVLSAIQDSGARFSPAGPTVANVGSTRGAAAGTNETPRLVARISPTPRGRVNVTDAVELSIGSHGIWAILGPNGSGKTSLLEAIAGVEPVCGVEIEWCEAPRYGPILAGQFPERQIFEERVRPEVSFAALRRGLAVEDLESRMKQMFVSMGLPPEFLERRTWELSIGEKRLVSLVGTLLAPASLILLDEPTCGLDATRRGVVADWVRVTSERIPIVVATQDRAWVRQMAAIEVPLGIHDGAGSAILAAYAKSQQETD